MLEKEVVNQLNNYLIKHGIRYSNEIRMGIGIPDVSLNMGASKSQYLIDDYYMLTVLEFVKDRKKTTINEIVNELSFSINKVRLYIENLSKMCLVIVKKQLVKFVRNIFNTDLGVTISIEVKLKDWKGGLIQAQRYKSFSDYSYLALPKSYIKNINLDLLENTGIGLLSIDSHEVVEVLEASRSSECNYLQKYILTSEILMKSDLLKKRRKDKVFSKYYNLET